MKKIIFLIAVLITTLSVAQTENETINYKAIIKDNLGNVVANNNNVLVQFKILEGVAQTNVFEEIHSASTDANGFLIVNIGDGTLLSQSLDAYINIDWASQDHFLNVQIDTGSGMVDVGTTAFKTVPYAKHAIKATTATTALNAGATSINGLSDAKSDNDGTNNGSSLFLGVDAGTNDDGTDNENVGVGFQALYSNTTGQYNTANGFEALFSNTTAFGNTANGFHALYTNSTGYANTASGSRALESNTTGHTNTADGVLALVNNTTGHSNTATGVDALSSNTTGHNNTAIGVDALGNNLFGNHNTANGTQALFSAYFVSNNTANGYQALYSNEVGNTNTANGTQALYNVQGSGNVALGYQAGFFETGNNKLYIANSDTNTPLIYGEFDSQILNLNGTTTINGSTNVFGNVIVSGVVIQNSDRRLKKDIEALPYGLKEILQLQPKAYNWKDKTQEHKSLGLIAQEVQPLIKEIVNAKDDEAKTLGINYTELIPVLINAIKEQQTVIDSQQLTVKSLQSEVNNNQIQVTTLESDVAELKTMVKQILVKDETALLEKR